MDKRVDVKSADDYAGGQKGGEANIAGRGVVHQNLNQGAGMNSNFDKPNPYVQVNTQPGREQGSDVVYSYPKSKVFVGGLDFNLTSDELKDHF